MKSVHLERVWYMYGSKCSPQNSPRQSAIVEGIAEGNSVFIEITSAKILPGWLFPSKIYIHFATFNTYFSTKLSFTNKRYNPVWIGTIRLEIKKTKWEEKKTDYRIWWFRWWCWWGRMGKWQRGRSLDYILYFWSYIIFITSVV